MILCGAYTLKTYFVVVYRPHSVLLFRDAFTKLRIAANILSSSYEIKVVPDHCTEIGYYKYVGMLLQGMAIILGKPTVILHFYNTS